METHGKEGVTVIDREAELAKASIFLVVFQIQKKESTFSKRAKLAAVLKELGIYVQIRGAYEPGLKQQEVTFFWLRGSSPDNARTACTQEGKKDPC